MFDPRNVSFGGTAAIVTSTGLIVGLDTATISREILITSLLIVGIADNLTDMLSVHIYQESEGLPKQQALNTTIANFGVRLSVCLSFVGIVALLPMQIAMAVAVGWGLLLLAGITYLVAKARRARILPEIVKHAAVAVAVIILSRMIGAWLPSA